MPTNFPTSLDSLTNPAGTDDVSVVDHAAQHSNANDAIEALEAKVGINSSAVTSSLDYLLKNASSSNPGHRHTTAHITGLATVATTGAYSDLSGTPTIPSQVFNTIAVSGQSNVVADSTTDTLTLVAGSGVTITTDAATDSITIAASGGGAPTGAEYVVLSTNGSLTHERVLTAGTGISITDGGAGSTVTVASTITQYTDEMAQDAVGGILVDSSEIDFTYNDATPSITASIVAGSIDETKLDASVNASLDLADSALQSESDTLQTVTDRGATTTNTVTLSPSGNNKALIANGSGTGAAIDITHSGSGTKLNIGATGSGDLIDAGSGLFKVTSGGSISASGLTASTILSADGSKNIVSLSTATYPSLTELSYVKGVTSAIQTQLTARATKTQTFAIIGKIGTVADQDYDLAIEVPFGGTIVNTTTKSTAGTCTATFKVNTTALGGTANSVSTTQDKQAHASSNTFSSGDDIRVTISSNSSCANISFTIEYTRSLS